MIRTYKYRIYPTRKQIENLNWTLEQCKVLYNSCLLDRKNHYEQTGKGLNYYDQASILTLDKKKFPFLYDIDAQVLQDVLRRVDKAYKSFYRRVKDKSGKAGYPRFKSENRYDSITYPHIQGFGLTDNGLKLSKIGTIKLKKHREYKGDLKTCTIKKQADKWYACLTVEYDNLIIKKTVIHTDKVVGVDVGLNSLAVDSNGNKIESQKFYRKSEKKLAKAQKRVSRKKKGSNNRKKAVEIVAKIDNHTANQRNDFLQKESSKTIKLNPDCIAFEDLNTSNMVKNPYLSKSINDASWGKLSKNVEYKAEEAGILFLRINPAYSSQECPQCHRIEKKELSERVHTCACGLTMDRDEASAVILKQRAIEKIRQELPEYKLVERHPALLKQEALTPSGVEQFTVVQVNQVSGNSVRN